MKALKLQVIVLCLALAVAGGRCMAACAVPAPASPTPCHGAPADRDEVPVRCALVAVAGTDTSVQADLQQVLPESLITIVPLRIGVAGYSRAFFTPQLFAPPRSGVLRI